MKIFIGPYKTRWISKIHDNYMHWKYGRYEWDDNHNFFERSLEKLEDGLQWVYNKTINKILDDNSNQKVKVRIDNYDLWNADYTLALIISPILEQLKDGKAGSPHVDDKDVPAKLRSTKGTKENEWDTDSNWQARWEYVLEEMSWAFAMKARPDGWEEDFWTLDEDGNYLSTDTEGQKKHQARMDNGFRLFGRYYECLWT